MIIRGTNVIVRVTTEHVLLPVWPEEVTVVGSSERVPDRNQPLKAKLPQFFRGVGVVARQRAREGGTSGSDVGDVEFNRGALEDGAMEKVLLLVRSRVQVAKDICRSSRFAEEGNVRGVTAKLGNGMINPFKEHLLITEA